jgi:hypothetical protein
MAYQPSASRSFIDLVVKRHGGHHHGGEDAKEETEEDVKARVDSARNHAAAEAFWYTIIAVLTIALALRLVRLWAARQK